MVGEKKIEEKEKGGSDLNNALRVYPTVRVFGLSTTAGISFREFLIPFVSGLTPVAVDCCQTIDPP